MEKWRDLVPEKKHIISEESAREQLGEFCSYYEIDFDDIAPEQSDNADRMMAKLLDYFMQGKIELKDSEEKGLCVIQHLKKGDTLTFRELKGSDRTRLQSAGDDATKRMHALAGILCGYGIDSIGKLPAGDLRVTETLAAFLLGFV
jgi:hypothetical protein